MKIDEIGFNSEWAKTKSKADFVAEFIDMEHIYSNLTNLEKTDALESAWKKLRNEPEDVAPIVELPPMPEVAKEKKGK